MTIGEFYDLIHGRNKKNEKNLENVFYITIFIITFFVLFCNYMAKGESADRLWEYFFKPDLPTHYALRSNPRGIRTFSNLNLP